MYFLNRKKKNYILYLLSFVKYLTLKLETLPTHHHPILIHVYPRKWGWPDLPHFGSNLPNSHSPSCSIHSILFLQTNTVALLFHLIASSTFSLVVLTSSCGPSLQIPTLFSKRAHHPSSIHVRTISLHLPLPSEPLFPSIPTSPLGN